MIATKLRRRRRMAALTGAMLIGGLGLYSAVVPAAEPTRLDVVELRQTLVSLKQTYAKGKRMGLPRLLLLDSQGRVILGETGFRDGLGYRIETAFKQDKPLATPITFDAILAEVEDDKGMPVAVSSVPKADAYIVDWWAEWCGPCRVIARDLQHFLPHSGIPHVVWIKVESDPQRLPAHG